jgi:hypothetical protein
MGSYDPERDDNQGKSSQGRDHICGGVRQWHDFVRQYSQNIVSRQCGKSAD